MGRRGRRGGGDAAPGGGRVDFCVFALTTTVAAAFIIVSTDTTTTIAITIAPAFHLFDPTNSACALPFAALTGLATPFPRGRLRSCSQEAAPRVTILILWTWIVPEASVPSNSESYYSATKSVVFNIVRIESSDPDNAWNVPPLFPQSN
jgi:hypothetical protein